jgi:flagellar motility protein MotE (MotC chaperone)
MKNLVAALVRAYAAVAAYTLALLAVIAVVLFSSGALTAERVGEAVTVLRTPKEKTVERTPAHSDEERRELEGTQRSRQETLDLREHELQRLDTRVAGLLGTVRRDQDDLAAGRRKLREDQDLLRKDQEALAAAKSDAEVAANLPILSKMDGAGIVSLMKSWDDARFVRYLRAMKPGKAAEVLETVRTDPLFETEFRRLPEDAPAGAKTRAERLVEEFKRVP